MLQNYKLKNDSVDINITKPKSYPVPAVCDYPDSDFFIVSPNRTVHIVRGDLFNERVDVLTNAANS